VTLTAEFIINGAIVVVVAVNVFASIFTVLALRSPMIVWDPSISTTSPWVICVDPNVDAHKFATTVFEATVNGAVPVATVDVNDFAVIE